LLFVQPAKFYTNVSRIFIKTCFYFFGFLI
jgi:hypothetical protein